MKETLVINGIAYQASRTFTDIYTINGSKDDMLVLHSLCRKNKKVPVVTLISYGVARLDEINFGFEKDYGFIDLKLVYSKQSPLEGNKMNIPDGQEIDYDNSTIVYKPIRKSLAWEDLGRISGYQLGKFGDIASKIVGAPVVISSTFYHTKNQAYASIAQAKLTQVMAAANGDWVADWRESDQDKWCIALDCDGEFNVQVEYQLRAFLSFKTRDLAQQAMEDNAQILEEYKPLAGS